MTVAAIPVVAEAAEGGAAAAGGAEASGSARAGAAGRGSATKKAAPKKAAPKKNPYKQGGLATPPPELDEEKPAPAPPEPPHDVADQAEEEAEKVSVPSIPVGASGMSIGGSGAGVILAVFAWSWVILPFLKGGPTGVRNMLKAKFTNKGPNGEYLP